MITEDDRLEEDTKEVTRRIARIARRDELMVKFL